MAAGREALRNIAFATGTKWEVNYEEVAEQSHREAIDLLIIRAV